MDARTADPRCNRTVRWSAITVRAGIQEQKLGRIDWDDWWRHEEARRQQGLLPADKKAYLRQAEALIKERYGVNAVSPSELRRIKAALYRGDSERPKRPNRKQPKLKGCKNARGDRFVGAPQNPTKTQQQSRGERGHGGACQNPCRASLMSSPRSYCGPSC